MPYRTMLRYWKSISAIQAEQYRMYANISLVPYMKKEIKDRFFKQLSDLYKRIIIKENEKELTIGELAKRLARNING